MVWFFHSSLTDSHCRCVWYSQVALCAPTAASSRRYATVTNTPARSITGRRGLGGLAPTTPLPPPSTSPRLFAAVRVPAPWECRLVRSSASESTWDRCHPRSKCFSFLPLLDACLHFQYIYNGYFLPHWFEGAFNCETGCRSVVLKWKLLTSQN